MCLIKRFNVIYIKLNYKWYQILNCVLNAWWRPKQTHEFSTFTVTSHTHFSYNGKNVILREDTLWMNSTFVKWTIVELVFFKWLNFLFSLHCAPLFWYRHGMEFPKFRMNLQSETQSSHMKTKNLTTIFRRLPKFTKTKKIK